MKRWICAVWYNTRSGYAWLKPGMLALLGTLAVAAPGFGQLTPYVDPPGYPAAWPAQLTTQAYTSKGSPQYDLTGNPDGSRGASLSGSVDFSSGQNNDQPSIFFSADGSILFIRLRVDGPPLALTGSNQPFDAATWNVMLDTDGDGFKEFVILLDGTGQGFEADPDTMPDDLVIIYDNNDSQRFIIGQDGIWRQDSAVGGNNGADGESGSSSTWDTDPDQYVWDFGRTRVVQIDQTGQAGKNNSEYYIDIQVPIAAFDASGIGGPTLTASTPFAIMATTSNSNTDPTQKDLLFAGDLVLADVPLPSGDVINVNGNIVQVPVVPSVVNRYLCPIDTLEAIVIDATDVVAGNVVDTIDSVRFEYYLDVNQNGEADDAGQAWTRIGLASLVRLGTWRLLWNITGMEDQYFVMRAVAFDDQGNVTESTNQSILSPSNVKTTLFTICPPTPPPGVSNITVTVANPLVGATSQYNIQMTTHEALVKKVDDIIFTFPAGTDISALTKQNADVNGFKVADVTVSGQTLTIRVQQDVGAGQVTVTLRNPPGVVNPLTAATYLLHGSTTKEPEVNPSNNYEITSTATLTSATVNPSSSVVGTQSAYRLDMKLGGSGALTGGSGTFTIVFPDDTVVPDGQIYGVTVNGTPAAAIGASGTRTIQVQTPVDLPNLADVTIGFALSSGLVNPTTPATYTLTVGTTAEPGPVTSNPYTFFDGTSLSPPTVTPDPTSVNTVAAYTINARLGANGGLTGGVDRIFLDFPATTIVPGTIAPSQVLVDDGTLASPAASVTTTPANEQVVITPGADIPDGAVISIVFKTEAGLVNPIQPVNYTLDMATSREDTVTSNQYLITQATSQITQPIVTLANSTKNRFSKYTIDFNVGSQGRLLAGTSTITFVFPSGTGVPSSIAASNVTVNGVASAGVTSDSGTRTVTVTVPSGVSIGNNAAVTVVIGSSTAVLRNPKANITVTLQASTSVEPTQVTSFGYAIGSGGSNLTFDSVALSVSTVNTTSGYTLFFTPGDRVETGDHVIFTFPNNTTVPASIDAANVKITPNGGSETSAQSVSTTPGLHQIDLVTGVDLQNNKSHKIEIVPAAGLINPSVPKNYTMVLRTSDEPTDVVSPQYTVAASATAIVVDSVRVSPSRAAEAGNYIIDFTVGSAGGLLAGNNTITVTFPAGTTVPASIAASTVTVNGAAAGTVTTDPVARTVTVVTPVTVPNNGHVTLNFATTSGIQNPPAGDYTLQVRTSAETNDAASPQYAITSNDALMVTSVVPTPSAVNASAGYTIDFQIGASSPLSVGDQIIVDFPDGTGVPSVMAAGDVRVNGTAATVAPFTDTVNKKVTVATPVAVAGNGTVTLTFTNAAGLLNPPLTGDYTLTVATSVQPTPVASPAYAITQATTTISSPNVTPSIGTVSQLATYTIQFNVGSQGALLGGTSTITFVFNDSTTLAGIQPSNVTVNGVQTQTVAKSGQTVAITVPTGVTIRNNDPVTVVIGSSTAVITNPDTPGNYTIQARTSVETTLVTSIPYPIGTATTTVTPAVVTPDPNTVDNGAEYTIDFNVGGQGALTAGSGTITLIFPNNTTVPFSMAAANVTVNGTPLGVDPVTSPTARSVTLTTPVNIANDGAVTVVFATAAGLRNPSTGGSYTLQVHTSAEPTKVTSQGYTIQAPNTTVTAANVTPDPNGVNSEAAYTIGFRVGSSGALQGGVSTITIAFPSGTTVPGVISPSKIKVNGTAAPTVSISGQEVTLTVPSSATIGNSDSVTVVFLQEALLQNPPVQGPYTLTVRTSAEPTDVVSNPYTIGAATTTVTQAVVTPVPATVGVTAAYTIDFNVGGSGALQAGSSSVTVTFNANTSLVSQTISGATVNGVAAQAVSDAASRTVTLTVPASVHIGNNGSVSVFIPSGVITNPVSANTYTLEVKTSVETTNVTSLGYPITTATTTVTAATVTPDPATANVNAQYTFAFNVGAEGALTGGTDTITLTFPNNTTIPASITPGDVTVNGTPVTASIVIDQSLRTVTLTTPVSIANSGSVTIVFTSAAGLVNPSAATYTARVRTSMEATNVTTNAYVIDPAATSILTPTVSVSPDVVETNAAYTVSFTVGAQGRLLAETSTIVITFPAAATVPASIAASTITVNGVAASTVNVTDKTVTITVPAGVTINNNATVSVVFATGAGLFNPSTPTAYTVDVHTSTETTVVTSNPYNIVVSSTTTTAATVIPNPGTQLLPAQYTIEFNTGSVGALQSGVSTITATFPAGTVVPLSILGTNVTVNGVNAAGVTTDPSARTVTATVPAGVSIGNNDNVILVIGVNTLDLTNPPAASYTAQVRTSVERTNVTSNPYTISSVTTTVDSAFVGPVLGGASPDGGPNPQTVNTTARYTVKFKLGAAGGLTAGSSQITLTFPDNTGVPTSIIPSFITVNGVTVTAQPTANASLRTITITVPSGTPGIAANDTVVVDISQNALLRNPSVAGLYRIKVRTSVEATDVPSKQYTISPPATSVTAAVVTPTPDQFGLNAQYRIDFSVGGQGALIGGASTITITFPSNTVVPGVIPPSGVTVNSTETTSVSADSVNRRATITVPSGVDIPNNGAGLVIFKTGAGLVNPDPGSKTLQVRTSVETTDVTSQAYDITSLAVLDQIGKISVHPRWSPSDHRIAFVTEAPDDQSGADTGNWNVFTIDKDGRNKNQVTPAISGGTIENGDVVHYSSITWTPDGDSLVYAGYERLVFPPADTVVTIQLFQIPRGGGAFKKISPRGAVEDTTQQFGGWLDPDWALTNYDFEVAQFPSGVHRIAASIDGNIWVFEPRNVENDGPGSTFRNLVQITNLPNSPTETDGLFQPRWSPDRKKIAAVYKDSSNATLSDIYVIADVDSIIQKTLNDPDYSTRNFDYAAAVGDNKVTALTDMTKITPAGNNKPAWTPSWSTDGLSIAYGQDQTNTFSLDTFRTSPLNAVAATNFYVKLRNSDGTGPDSTLIGLSSSNNAFPEMAHNGQRMAYFQGTLGGSFVQSKKVFFLQTTGKFEPPSNPRVVTKNTAVVWKLADMGFSSVEFPITAVGRKTDFFIFEPQPDRLQNTDTETGRFLGVARTFGPLDVAFSEPARVTVHYTDGEFAEAGLVAESAQEDRLALFYYNPGMQAWERVQDSTVDPNRNLVSGTTTKLGTFGVFYAAPGAGQLFSQVMVYPNPFKPNSGSIDDGDYNTGVIFDLLPQNLERLDIYNIAGEWVASMGQGIVPTGVPGQWRWRGVNDAGRRVASGIYIYVMEAAGERKIGKIGVIR